MIISDLKKSPGEEHYLGGGVYLGKPLSPLSSGAASWPFTGRFWTPECHWFPVAMAWIAIRTQKRGTAWWKIWFGEKMAQAKTTPETTETHHINGDPKNWNPDKSSKISRTLYSAGSHVECSAVIQDLSSFMKTLKDLELKLVNTKTKRALITPRKKCLCVSVNAKFRSSSLYVKYIY